MASVEQFRPLAAEAAARWSRRLAVQLPPELVLAVMRQENPRADTTLAVREPDGHISRGLMMVKDTTAVDLGLDDPRRLTMPAVGIDLGVHYLAQQLARYQGSVPKAVAAYNAGSARFTEQEQFINQPYVDRVLAFFRELGGRPAPALTIGAGLMLFGLLFAAWKASQARRGRA